MADPAGDLPDALDALRWITDPVAVLDGAGIVTWANELAEELLGPERGPLVGSSMLDLLHPDDVGRAVEVLVGLPDAEGNPIPITPARYRVRTREGWRLIDVNGARSPGSDGGFLIIGRLSWDRELWDRILEQLTTGADLDEVVALVPQFARDRHSYDESAVLYHDGAGQRRTVGSAAISVLDGVDDVEWPWDRAARTGEYLVVQRDEAGPRIEALLGQHGLETCWAAPVPDPLRSTPAVVIGFSASRLTVEYSHRYTLGEMERALSLILQWRGQRVSLEQAARVDPLTGIANRTRIFEVLERWAARPDPALGDDALVAVLFVDLDDFKVLNDRHGHAVGDVALRTVARRIGSVLRPDDLVGRLGGDEFLVACGSIGSVAVAEELAGRIIEVVSTPQRIEEVEVQVGASVGIACVPRRALRPDAIVEEADAALYRAKAAGRGRFETAT